MKKIMIEGKKGAIIIPDTVIYKHGFPSAWYFTSAKDGTIKRKKTENLTLDALLAAFLDLDAPERVVCYFVNTTWDTSISPTNNVTFMDSRELRRFIIKQNPMSVGFLQRWVASKAEKHGHTKHDTNLHCTWTPHRCFVQQREIFSHVSSQAHSIDKSLQSNFLEPHTNVIKLPPANKLHVRIAAICELIASHIYNVTKDKLVLHGLTGEHCQRIVSLWGRQH